MLLCPKSALAVEVCECGDRHICPVCELPVFGEGDFGEPTCDCEHEGEVTAIVEVW